MAGTSKIPIAADFLEKRMHLPEENKGISKLAKYICQFFLRVD